MSEDIVTRLCELQELRELQEQCAQLVERRAKIEAEELAGRIAMLRAAGVPADAPSVWFWEGVRFAGAMVLEAAAEDVRRGAGAGARLLKDFALRQKRDHWRQGGGRCLACGGSVAEDSEFHSEPRMIGGQCVGVDIFHAECAECAK